jgi:hypothetical protein
MPRLGATTPFVVLAILLGLGAVMLYRAPIQRYVVACERTTHVACVLEQARATRTQRWHRSLGANASAVVRVVQPRRGTARVFLYIESAAGAMFAAEFEGNDADTDAEAAAAQLNRVLEGTTPGVARVEAAPPPLYRRFAWGALGVMGMLVLAGYRDVRARARAA